MMSSVILKLYSLQTYTGMHLTGKKASALGKIRIDNDDVFYKLRGSKVMAHGPQLVYMVGKLKIHLKKDKLNCEQYNAMV